MACEHCGLAAPMHALDCARPLPMPVWFTPADPPMDLIAFNESIEAAKKKSRAKPKQELPGWLMKQPRSKRQRAEMIRWCRHMDIEIPQHLID